MRTTLTIDDDISVQLQELRKTRGASLKTLINAALRAGLKQLTEPNRPTKPYATKSVSLGKCLISNVDDISESLAVGENDDFR